MNGHGFNLDVITMIVICLSLEAIITLLGGSTVNEAISLHFGFFAYQLMFWIVGFFAGLAATSTATYALKKNGVINVDMGTTWLLRTLSGVLFVAFQVGILYGLWLLLSAVYLT
jgi:hypothetical protein